LLSQLLFPVDGLVVRGGLDLALLACSLGMALFLAKLGFLAHCAMSQLENFPCSFGLAFGDRDWQRVF
jgi:hypothetical protein